MKNRRARFQSASRARLHVDTHLAIQLIAQHEAETRPRDCAERQGAYRRRRVRSGIVADLHI